MVSWRTRAGRGRAPSWSLVPVLLPKCKFANKVISEGAPGPGAGAWPGPAASQVASIRCRPAQDNRAVNPKVYGAVPLAKEQGRKKQNWSFQTLARFFLAFCLASHSWPFSFIPCFPLETSPPPPILTWSSCSFCWASGQLIVWLHPYSPSFSFSASFPFPQPIFPDLSFG